MIGGTIVGAAIVPFSQNVRTLFLGTSVGLYLGIVVGLYYVFDRYDQQNPLRTRQDMRRNENGAVDQEQRSIELRSVASKRVLTGFESSEGVREPMRVDVPVLRF